MSWSMLEFVVSKQNASADRNVFVLTERVHARGQVDWIYFVAFAATAGGIVLYSYKYVSFCHHFTATVLATTEYYGCIVLAQHERPGFARRGSNEVEETAQVAGASDEHGKGRDEEAGTRNPA